MNWQQYSRLERGVFVPCVCLPVSYSLLVKALPFLCPDSPPALLPHRTSPWTWKSGISSPSSPSVNWSDRPSPSSEWSWLQFWEKPLLFSAEVADRLRTKSISARKTSTSAHTVPLLLLDFAGQLKEVGLCWPLLGCASPCCLGCNNSGCQSYLKLEFC